MAAEKDFELLEEYLSDRLSGDDKVTFEKKLEADPELQRELKIQQNFIAGIRSARVAELKSMLSAIPVTAVQTGSNSIITKVGTWVVATGIIATGLYFYFNENNPAEPTIESIPSQQNEIKTQPVEIPKESEPVIEKVEPNSKKSNDDKLGAPKVKTPAVTQPTLDVYDPTKEETDEATREYEHEQLEIISNAFVTSSIAVELEHSNRKYNFHYMFKNNKLVLYGAFEEHLYEILEFISDQKRTVVLFYESNYYLLNIDKSDPTQLTPIRDKALLKKLREYRGK